MEVYMREFFKKIRDKVRAKAQSFAARVYSDLYMKAAQARTMLAANSGENFVDSGVKILIAVVIGALLLAGLYALFGDTIMPTVTQKVNDMFNFKG